MPRSTSLTYPKTPINTVNRYDVRETYDLAKIHEIINECSVLQITLNAPGNGNPFPICLPMVGVAASYDHPSAGLDEVLDVYVHGYVSARMMNLSRNGEAQGENGVNGEEKKGLPVTVSATKVDGLVLSLTPYTHDINYRSATLFGYASLVTSPDEKIWAMQQITNSVLTDRWQHTRVPPTSAELSSTAILKVKVVGGSGKIRVGGPRDEAKDVDMKDAEGGLYREKVWTGVVPVWEALGEPVWGGVGVGEKGAGEVPEHVRGFAEERRKKNEDYAFSTIQDRSQD